MASLTQRTVRGATQQNPTVHAATPRSFFGSRTDVGCVREHNEDSLLVMPPLFVVADGMGGYAAGEVASEIVVRALERLAPTEPDADALAGAIVAANLDVIKAPKQGIGKAGMGTTCTAAMLKNERLLIAQVGDSRAYLLHAGHLQQLTRDHSLMADLIESGRITKEEARFHPDRSVITRAIGSDPYMQPDIYELNVAGGDRLLLCSDGLTAMLTDQQIARLLCANRDPQACADALVSAAVQAGGYDNVTVIVVDVQGSRQAKEQRRIQRKYKALGAFIVVALVAIFAGGGFAFSQYLNNSAYLIEENGMVSVYRGVPDELFGITFSSLEQTTDIPVDQLSPGVANRIKDGMQVGSMDEAMELIETYRSELESQQSTGSTQENTSDAQEDTASNGASDSSSGTVTLSAFNPQGGE